MKILLVFVSPNGTTRSSAKLLKESLNKYNHDIEMIDIGSKLNRENHKVIIDKIFNTDVDIIGFGCPAYHMDMLGPMQKLLSEMSAYKTSNKTPSSFLFLNYAGITSGKAFQNFFKYMKSLNIGIVGGIKIYAPHFHHNETFPNEDTVLIVNRFIESIEKNNYRNIPIEKARQLFSPSKKITNIIYPFVHIIGKFRELPITIENSKCKKCNKCISECPVGSIQFTNGFLTIDKTCIHCYHCTTACKFGAIMSPTRKLDVMIAMNKKIVGSEEPINQYFVGE